MKLIFGCAHFSGNYGLSKKKYKIVEVNNIFNFIKKKKINFLDTAPTYEGSIKFNKIKFNKFKVYSKIKIPKEINKKNLEQYIFNTVKSDLHYLNLKTIEGLYVHEIEDLKKFKNKIYNIFVKLKKKKLIKKICLSHYNLNDEFAIYKYFKPDIIQIPINILNLKFLDEKKINFLKRRGIKIFARSIYLQGLIFKKILKKNNKFENIQKAMGLIENDMKFNTNIKKIDLTVSVLKKLSFLDGIIFSGSSVIQIKNFLNSFNKNINIDIEKLLNYTKEINYWETDPRRWDKKKKKNSK